MFSTIGELLANKDFNKELYRASKGNLRLRWNTDFTGEKNEAKEKKNDADKQDDSSK